MAFFGDMPLARNFVALDSKLPSIRQCPQDSLCGYLKIPGLIMLTNIYLKFFSFLFFIYFLFT